MLHPWGHEERGCYSVFLELANSQELPKDFSRFVRLEFAMHAWDTAYQVMENLEAFRLERGSEGPFKKMRHLLTSYTNPDPNPNPKTSIEQIRGGMRNLYWIKHSASGI